jgi:hypothetical protein
MNRKSGLEAACRPNALFYESHDSIIYGFVKGSRAFFLIFYNSGVDAGFIHKMGKDAA